MNNLFFFLTEDDKGKYAIMDIEDYDKLKASLEIVERLKEAETNGGIDIEAAKEGFRL